MKIVLGSLVVTWLALSTGGPTTVNASAMPITAEQSWQHIEQLHQQLSADAPKGVNEVEFSAPVERELHDAATAFTRDHPDDPHRWDAQLLELKTAQFPIPPAERRAVFDHQEALAAEILAAPGAAATVKQAAERAMIAQHLDHLDLIETPAQATALEARIADYLARHPDDSKAYALQVRRLDLLEKCDPARAAALLDTLAANADPKIADAARGRQQQRTLASTPLDWGFTAVDGTRVDLAQWHGKFVLVDFWASWCPDCLRETPDTVAAYRRYHDRGLEIVGVSLDHDRDALIGFTKKYALPWPQQFDGQGWNNAYAVKYGVRGIPEMWLVDRTGRVVATGLHGSQLEAKLAPLLPP